MDPFKHSSENLFTIRTEFCEQSSDRGRDRAEARATSSVYNITPKGHRLLQKNGKTKRDYSVQSSGKKAESSKKEVNGYGPI